MLKEEQVAELLLRCEKILGHKLPQIRGNLRNASSRSAAVWELLIIEAVSYLGSIEYEPLPGASPDIRLSPLQGRPLWIEVAYLYPRFWQKERQSQAVTYWLFKEAKRRGIPAWKICPELDGDHNNKAGPVRILPNLNERRKFLKEPELINFFEEIIKNPEESRRFSLVRYSIAVSYLPHAKGPYASSRGLVQEAPTTIEEHAVYRVLRRKAEQHNVSGPRIICLGSDQSPALSSLYSLSTFGQLRISNVVGAAFLKNRSLSAVIVVTIQDTFFPFFQSHRQARGQIFLNPHTETPLTQEESQLLGKINLNRWKYTFTLQKWEYPNNESCRRVSGSLTCKPGGFGMEIGVPANIVIDALAGKTSLAKEFQLAEDEPMRRALDEGWVIESCELKEGNIEAGEAPKVVFELVPPSLSVFWSKRKDMEKPNPPDTCHNPN